MAILTNTISSGSLSFLHCGNLWREPVAGIAVQTYSTWSDVDIMHLAAVAVYTELTTVDVRLDILRVSVA